MIDKIKEFFSEKHNFGKIMSSDLKEYKEIDWDKVRDIEDVKTLMKLRYFAVDIRSKRVSDKVKSLVKDDSGDN